MMAGLLSAQLAQTAERLQGEIRRCSEGARISMNFARALEERLRGLASEAQQLENAVDALSVES